MLDVVAVGDICVDLLTPPLEGFSLGDRQLWVPSLPMVPGGNAANFALGASALGLRAGLAACLGGDPISAFLRDDDGCVVTDPYTLEWSGDWTFDYTLDYVLIYVGVEIPVVNVTYLAWDSFVVPLDPYTGEPLNLGEGMGGEGGGAGGGGDGTKDEP